MFSYVDPGIRQRLEREGQLVHLDARGQPTASRPCISLLGPIPLPRRAVLGLCHEGPHPPLTATSSAAAAGRVPEDGGTVAGPATDGGDSVPDRLQLSWWVFVRRVELDAVLASAGRVAQGDQQAFLDLVQGHMTVNSVLAWPGFVAHPDPLVRVHSSCLTGDVFGSLRCECGPQLAQSFERIAAEGTGAIVYMASHEGRGIGLWAKAATYLLQDSGQDTYQANVSLGLPEDSRDFGDAAIVVRHLRGGRPIRLLTNNPMKVEQLRQGGQPVSAVVPVVAGVGHHNLRYLRSKRAKGHLLPDF